MRKIISLGLLLLIAVVQSKAQSDITNLVLTNANFDEQFNFNAAAEAENLASANQGVNIKEVYGWEIASIGDNSAAASFEYGYAGWLNSQDNADNRGAVPASGYNGSTGGALGISVAWTATVAYAQAAYLPAGSYAIEYAAYNSREDKDADNSKVGWIPDSGDAVLSSKTAFTVKAWDIETLPFNLAVITSGKIQVGLNAPDVGSGDVGRIFFDYIKLTCNSIDKTELQTLLTEANTLYGNGTGTKAPELRTAIDAINAVIGQDNTSKALIDAAVNLGNAVLQYKTTNDQETFLAEALIELEDLLVQAEELISTHNPNLYPSSTQQALETAYTVASNAWDADELTATNVQGYIDQLQLAINNYLASALGLKIHYDFSNVRGDTVPDISGSGYNGTLYNEAAIQPMGKYNVLNLGNGTGYLDVGTSAGNVISSMSNFTVSAYYRVDKNASLSGNGYFLYAFSVLSANSATSGPYLAYRLNAQKFALATNGYNNEVAITLDAEAEKDVWQHVLYRQNGNSGELYIDGQQVGFNDEVPVPSTIFTTPTQYNWIGRAPFTGDNYLKNTLVYDFRFYNQSVPVDSITKWAELVTDLEHEYAFGDQGDFTALRDLIAQYNTLLANVSIGDGVGQYPQAAVYELEDAISAAQVLVDENKASQFLVDAQIADLKAAYDKFLSSAGFAMTYPSEYGADYPFESGLYYIEVGDYYLTVPETGVRDTKLELRPYIENADKVHNNQVWNIQYNPTWSLLNGDEDDRALYSFVSDTVVWGDDGTWHMDEIGRMKKGNTIEAQSETDSNWDWREHRIYFNGTAYSIVNNHNGNAIVFANETENEQAQSLADKKFNFRFRSINDVVAIQTPAVDSKAKIYGVWNEIVVSNAGAGSGIAVYDISGRLIKTQKANAGENRIPVTQGLYIVKVAGQTPVASKVIVR
jgi:hypothetical protein